MGSASSPQSQAGAPGSRQATGSQPAAPQGRTAALADTGPATTGAAVAAMSLAGLGGAVLMTRRRKG
ncbi:LPXTG cell wall anchor domain-containing protein [Actinomyces bowdenii]|uniref:LPXTG cell wall anchor domain-containing protein n=1 Tax=Actinomyces bowdenii TaxID=131109 RepID=A0A3P1UWW1_9ACTO|nr:LPXTG cell wall anchor domain-containing protein [Actinomyces bowdenii]MBO3724874.1 LPXTG cell wall anchor domain-containing protein [Actinomyces bowdenii]RRD26108.1 LPXTG cell wall anchor domain-containing protein [Actinomyces bowdenii]